MDAEESECESGAENESERDGEEDDDDSDDDLQIVGEHSGTADSTGASSAGTEAPAKKAKITLTEEQERFAKQFLPDASKVVRTRKISVRHVSGRGSSTRKQGARLHDVKPDTLKKRVLQFPDQFLQVQGGQLYCVSCSTNVGSSMRLTITIRRSLTLTTLNYRCSHSLTNEACGSTVSR